MREKVINRQVRGDDQRVTKTHVLQQQLFLVTSSLVRAVVDGLTRADTHLSLRLGATPNGSLLATNMPSLPHYCTSEELYLFQTTSTRLGLC